MDYQAYQKAIEQLVADGNIILQIIMPDGESLYFSVYKWQEGYFNTAQSIDFNTVEGVNITDFLKKNASQYRSHAEFMTLYDKAMQDGILVRCEFTKGSTWYKWSSPDGVNRR